MPASIIKIVARGVLGASVDTAEEIWSCGLNFSYPENVGTVMTQAQANSLANSAFAAWTDMITAASCNFQSNVWLTEARTYLYDGTKGSKALVVGISDPHAAVHGTSTPTVPNQVSLVASLEAAGRVKPKYGRIYLPMQSFPLLATGHLNTGSAGSTITQLRTVMNGMTGDINSIVGQNGRTWGAYIVSTIAGRDNQPVALLRGGTVLDTQRRRRNKESEAYTDLPYPGV